MKRKMENISLTPCIVSHENNLSIFTTPIMFCMLLFLRSQRQGIDLVKDEVEVSLDNEVKNLR